jgi:hypothetical protein
MSLMCNWAHCSICVTLLPWNSSSCKWEDIKLHLNGVFKGKLSSTILEFQDDISQLVKNIHNHQQQMLTWEQMQKGFDLLNLQAWFFYFKVHFMQ